MKILNTLVLSAFLLSPLVNAGTVESTQDREVSVRGSQYTPATIKKIDKENGKITLRHAEIKQLDMPRMTMVFKLALPDNSLIDTLKVGEDVDVVFDRINNNIVVKEIVKP